MTNTNQTNKPRTVSFYWGKLKVEGTVFDISDGWIGIEESDGKRGFYDTNNRFFRWNR